MQHCIDARRRNEFASPERPTSLKFHRKGHVEPPCNSDFVSKAIAVQVRDKGTAWGGKVGSPPQGLTAMPAGGSKSGWHQWQIPHFMHHHRSPHDGQILTFMMRPPALSTFVLLGVNYHWSCIVSIIFIESSI